MDLVLLYKALVRRKWLLILLPLVGGLAAFAFTLSMKHKYQSRAQFSTGFTIKDVVKSKDQDFNLMESDVQFSNLIETLVSTKVTGLLSYKLLLHDLESDPPFRNKSTFHSTAQEKLNKINWQSAKVILKGKLDSMQLLNSNNKVERQLIEAIAAYGYDYEALNKILYITRVQRTDYVDVYAKTEDPYLSAFIVNTVCSEFLRYNKSLQSERSTESVESFSKQVAEKRKILDQKQNNLTSFKSSVGVLDLKVSGNSKVDLINAFEQELSKEKSTLSLASAELQGVNARLGNTGGTSDAANIEIVRLRDQINKLDQDYQSSKDPAILKQIEALKAKRASLITDFDPDDLKKGKEKQKDLEDKRAELNAQVAASRSNIASIQRNINGLKSNVGSYASKEAVIDSMEREVDLAKQEYTSVSEKYNKAFDINSYSSTGIKQTLIGQPAVEAESSNRLIIIAITMVSAFLLCVLVIIILEYFDLSFKTPENFIKRTGLNLLGTLSFVKSLKGADPSSENQLKGFETDNDKKRYFELLKKIRYEFESMNAKVILFTSTQENQGKTTLLNILAYHYANTKRKVLLIDANFANNDLTEHFEIKPKFEQLFSQDLHEQSDVDAALFQHFQDSIEHTEHENVDIIGCSPKDFLPSEFFPENNPFRFIKELSKDYHYVFIEGAPLNQYADSKEYSQYVDAVIAIFAADSVIKYLDQQSIDFLTKLGPKFKGCILNKVQLQNLG